MLPAPHGVEGGWAPAARRQARQHDAAAILGAKDEAGPPLFASVVLTCKDPFIAGSGVTRDQTAALFQGRNNNSAFTSTLTMTFVNGANEAAVPAFDPKQLSAYFDTVSYIGAVKDASDTWYRGWTCDSATANFGSGSACTALPIYN